ncbi:MAG: protein jag [Clostridiales bacterium]|nr:protein jag [Clostridiales bacterium]
MRSIQSSAKTMEEAVTQGLEKLGASLGDVTIDILDEGSKGFLGLLGSKPVVVRLTLREDGADADALSAFSLAGSSQAKEWSGKKKGVKEKAEAAKEKVQSSREKTGTVKEKAQTAKEKVKPAQAPKQGRQERNPQDNRVQRAEQASTDRTATTNGPDTPAPLRDPETPEGRAQQFMLKVTQLMGVNVSVAAGRDEEGNVRVDMHGDTLGILIGRRGETLDALQYLTSLFVNKGQEDYIRVTLDTENYRAKREEALTRLANRMASRAIKTGRKVVMEPMNPYERRILHSALQQNDAVTTHSEGDEPNRHVVITLKQNQ